MRPLQRFKASFEGWIGGFYVVFRWQTLCNEILESLKRRGYPIASSVDLFELFITNHAVPASKHAHAGHVAVTVPAEELGTKKGLAPRSHSVSVV
jgi:hypothetical protein